MNVRRAVVLAAIAITWQPPPTTVPFDTSGVRPGPVTVARAGNGVSVMWPDETGRMWRATFALDPAQPLVSAIGLDGAEPVVRNARAFYQGETGRRRGGWYAFFDDPTTHPDGTRHVQGTFALRGSAARSIGERLQITFDGMRMGSFEGALSYTFYPGSRLIQQEAILTTNEPDVAYYYDAGLEMAAAADRQPGNNMQTKAAYYDTRGRLQQETLNGLQAERVPVQARYRALALKTAGGSIAAFPAPHQYFFPRDFTSNLGFVWQRAWRGRAALGIRQLRDENWQYYPWMNAPPGRAQRMGIFFLLSDDAPGTALADVLRYTNADKFRPLDGYKTLSTHWHLADTVQAVAYRQLGAQSAPASRGPRRASFARWGGTERRGAEGSPQATEPGPGAEPRQEWAPAFKPVLKTMGVDASIIMDFHGDGHPGDLTDVRLQELDDYFKTTRAQSDPEFLLIPAEEANVHLGGHWALVFPKPVYWFMNRPKNGAFVSTHTKYGTVYSVANPQEMFDLVRLEGGFMYQTHPRTKGSTGYPDKILDADYFRHDSYLGVGWKALPSDLSSPRLGDRVFDLIDDLSNRGLRKRMLGEVDVFQFDETHELYAHMNINYVKLASLPPFDRWGEALAPLTRGEFFTTTGEVLLPDLNLSSSSAAEIVVDARVEWTFPLRFAEIVWGDGRGTHREEFDLADAREFGRKTFQWRVNAPGWTWARVAVWDVAGNGAFVNPYWYARP